MAEKQESNKTNLLISESTPAEDFAKLIKENVENCTDDEMKTANFQKYCSEIRKIITSMIFEATPVNKQKILKTLKVYRDEACFYNPYDYNDWIKEIKIKLIEKEKLDIWEEIIVKNELGLLWARDCDFFDNMNDKEPIEFYKIETKSDNANKKLQASEADKLKTQNESIETVTSADHFLKLVKEKVEQIDPDDDSNKLPIFDKLSQQMQTILTDSIANATPLDYNRIGRDIEIYRDQACFYNPYNYNDWIQEMKTKIIERKMISFWENVIVRNELGLLWAEDCDFFDNMNDCEPKKFYQINPSAKNSNKLTKVGFLTPAQDYKTLVETEVDDVDEDREDEKNEIFEDLSKQIRNIIHDLLFKPELRDLNKAAEALKTYRSEAGFYNPYDFNDWIKDIKTKLIENKMLDFWQNEIVKNELGLLWAKNCDFFDDMNDKEPDNFYKI